MVTQKTLLSSISFLQIMHQLYVPRCSAFIIIWFKVEHQNEDWKRRTSHLKGNYTDHSLQLMARSISCHSFRTDCQWFRTLGIDKVLDDKLAVKYIGGVEEKTRKKKKRKEKFKSQVRKGVNLMMVRIECSMNIVHEWIYWIHETFASATTFLVGWGKICTILKDLTFEM